jgi:hypothetical protein
MKVGRAAVVVLMFVLAGCALSNSSPAHGDQHWVLVAATPTREYPKGEISAPIEQWPRVTEYASLDDCADSLWRAANELQLPVQCVAMDDPRLRNAPQLATVSIARSEAPAPSETRMLAVRQLPAF